MPVLHIVTFTLLVNIIWSFVFLHFVLFLQCVSFFFSLFLSVSTDVFIAKGYRMRKIEDILTHNSSVQDAIGLKTQVERKRWGGGRGGERKRWRKKNSNKRMAWVMLILLLIQRVYYHGHNMQCCVHTIAIEWRKRTKCTSVETFLPCNCILSAMSSLAQEPKSRVVCVWVIFSRHHPNLISDSPLRVLPLPRFSSTSSTTRGCKPAFSLPFPLVERKRSITGHQLV